MMHVLHYHKNSKLQLSGLKYKKKKRKETFRASCVEKSREMVTHFCAPMKSMTTSQRIEKAVDRLGQRYGVIDYCLRLRQRYSVSGGLTFEPNVIAICH